MSSGRARGNFWRGRGQRFRGQRRGNSQAGRGMTKKLFSFDLNDTVSTFFWKTGTIVIRIKRWKGFCQVFVR